MNIMIPSPSANKLKTVQSVKKMASTMGSQGFNIDDEQKTEKLKR
jgi:hypothetical protein